MPWARTRPDDGPRTEHTTRRGWFRAFVVLSLAAIVFMWEPISTGHYYAAGDLSGLSPILSPKADGVPGRNVVFDNQTDVIVDILPWERFNRDEIRSGHLPLWNPYSNSGAPQLANIQSAVFSPFKIPFYLLSMRIALLASSYLMLMAAGLGTFGLMRHLRVTTIAAIASAIVFMFSTYIIQWFRWPLSDTAAVLPWITWTAGALVVSRGRRMTVRRGVAFSVVLATGIVAGHPETLLFGAIPTLVWCTARIVEERGGLRRSLLRAVTVAIAAAGGVALAAIQVLPFVEYLSRSSIVTTRILQGYQSTRWSTVQVFPLFAGSPAAHYSGPYGIADPFHEIVVFYVGIFALWLAAVALATSRRTHRRAPWIFAACGAVLIAYAYNVGGIGKLTGHLPFLASVMPNRSAAAWSLCIAVLVGFGVDALARLDAPARRNARWQLLAVTGMLTAAAAVLGYRGWHLVSFSNAGKSTQRGIAMSTLTHHVVFIMVTFAVGCVCAYLHAGSTNGHSKRLGGWGVVVVLFLQGGFLFRHHNPTVPSDRFMAVPAVTKSIASRIGANQTLWADAATLTPSVNLWIPTYSPDNYDVIGIASYERLYRAVLDPPAKFIVGGAQVSMLTGPYSPASDDSLRTLGIRRIVTNLDYPNEFGIASLAPAPVDMDNGQTLDYDAPYFHPTNLVLHTQGLPDESRIEITSGGDRPWTREATVYGGLATIELPDKIPARGSLTATVAGRGPAWSGRVVSGTFIDSNMPGLRLVDSIGQFHIFAVPGPSGFVFSPAATLHAANTDDAFEAAIDPHRSPPDSVVLEGPGTTTRGKPGTVTVRAQDPTRVAATVTRTSPGYVVFNQNDLPGWRATVDGRAARIVRANSTFMAVAVPEGTSQVTFRYQPRTVRIGMLISLAAIVAGIATLVVAAVLDRRRSRSAP